MSREDYSLTIIDSEESLCAIQDGQCPFCLSERTSFCGITNDAMWCLNCNAEWILERKLTGIRIVKHPKGQEV